MYKFYVIYFNNLFPLKDLKLTIMSNVQSKYFLQENIFVN